MSLSRVPIPQVDGSQCLSNYKIKMNTDFSQINLKVAGFRRIFVNLHN